MRASRLTWILAALLPWGCAGQEPSLPSPPAGRVRTHLTWLKDSEGRYLYLHGVNLSGSTKVPKAVDGRVLTPQDLREAFNRGVPSYVGKPWDLQGCRFQSDGRFDPSSEATCQAAQEIRKLRRVGFNVFRFLLNWEGVEPTGPGQYDEAYLDSIAKHVQVARHYGIYLLLDMHQDSFSRHLVVKYNEKPSYRDEQGRTVYPPRGSLENMILSLVGPYTDTVRGEGAPRWAVEACLYEKNLDADTWGIPRLISGLGEANLSSIIDLLRKVMPATGDGSGPAVPPWAGELLSKIPSPAIPVTDTSDLLPFTNWGIMSMTSIDTARCFACLLSGYFGEDDPYRRGGAYKGLLKDGVPISRWMQQVYAKMWRRVVKALKDQNGGKVPENVIGYDIINEPNGNFITMTAAAAIFDTGFYQSAKTTLVDLLGKETGEQVFDLLTALRLLPVVPEKPGEGASQAEKDAWQAEIDRLAHDWGFRYADFLGIASLNVGYDRNYMTPFYEVVGREIFEEDPEAVIWFEPSMSIAMVLGNATQGWWDMGMTKPRICRCEDESSPFHDKAVSCDIEASQCGRVREAGTVYAPHFYADIYPFLGFNYPSRDFSPEEVRHRNYDDGIAGVLHIVDWNLEKIPAVLGEFGTYYNFGNIEKSHSMDYLVSAHILDNYYETLERMRLHRILWCYTPDNDPRYGDWWNKEDFSIWRGWKDLVMDRDIGLAEPSVTTTERALAEGAFRAERAWSRPYPKALAGKLLSLHFYSPYHYFDPDKGEVPPEREFEVVYAAKETQAPTLIFVPEVQYPDGFYVWLSDGYAYWDEETRTLHHFPTNDDPGARHFVRILPPLEGRPATGWNYFIRGTEVVAKAP